MKRASKKRNCHRKNAGRGVIVALCTGLLFPLLLLACSSEPSNTTVESVAKSSAAKDTSAIVRPIALENTRTIESDISPKLPFKCIAGSWTEIFKTKSRGWFTAMWANDVNSIFVAGKFRPAEESDNWEFPVFHFDGKEWTKHPTQAISSLWSLNGTSAEDVYGVGGYRAIHHWGGKSWTQEHVDLAVSIKKCLDDIYIDDSGNVTVFGESVFQKNKDAWRLLRKGSVDSAVWGSVYKNVTLQKVPPGLPSYVSQNSCEKISGTWVCSHGGERIFSYQEGTWRCGTFPGSCRLNTKLTGKWYAGCFKGLRRRDSLIGTNKWEKIDTSPHWDMTTRLSHGELISTDRQGRWYILDNKGIHEYPVSSSSNIVPFEIGDHLIAASGNSIYCMKRPTSPM